MVESCKGFAHQVCQQDSQVSLVGQEVQQHPLEVGLEVVLLMWVVQTWAHSSVEVGPVAAKVAVLLEEEEVALGSSPFWSFHPHHQKCLNIVLDF